MFSTHDFYFTESTDCRQAGIFDPDKRLANFAEGFLPMIASVLADNEFMSGWLFRLPTQSPEVTRCA
jgi:hypothetical protein